MNNTIGERAETTLKFKETYITNEEFNKEIAELKENYAVLVQTIHNVKEQNVASDSIQDVLVLKEKVELLVQQIENVKEKATEIIKEYELLKNNIHERIKEINNDIDSYRKKYPSMIRTESQEIKHIYQ